MQKTYKITISGQVQGVGFRPHVYVLANSHHLKGTVSNNEEGVIIIVAGTRQNASEFYNNLITNPPKVSKIDQHQMVEIEPMSFDDFRIIPSNKSGKLNLQLTPDFAICEDCKQEIDNPQNRRHQYPFTTCVNCGPRWSITNNFPFERDHTSIAKFQMCEECEQEYTDPLDRRFHSQTNSCAKCGISLRLVNREGEFVKIHKSEIIKKVADLLQNGNIVAIKNTGGYLLCCDATNSSAVQKLREKKKRPTKPFAILYPSLELLKSQLHIDSECESELLSSESPIVIVPKTNYKGDLVLNELAPGLEQLGIMIAYTGILELLSKELSMPIVATSGNIHGSPIISSEETAFNELSGIADYFVHHDLEILNPQDDSVVKFSSKFNHKVVFRRSRGYAPNFDGKYSGQKKIMAMGGHLKSTIAFLPNDYLYISQYLGNMDNFAVYERFTEVASKFIDLFEQKPEVVLVDSHPAYNSSQYGHEIAQKLGADLHEIQHHEAHFTSVLGENELFNSEDKILGVVWDGTGYGRDGTIWGGEFFLYESNHIERIAHLENFDWLASDKMSKEPRLSLLSLSDIEMQDVLEERFTAEELSVYGRLKKQNTLKTSSVGRLFDAVASLLDICHFNTYEGEAAILIENSITGYELKNCKSYCSLDKDGQIPTYLLIKKMYSDLEAGTEKETIILNYLFTLANFVFQVADQQRTKKLALSGGVFQNTVLIDMLIELAGTNYTLFFNRNLSPNDENISFGQIMHYLHIKTDK